ncbi:uncharacterized protein LOC126717498 isoform X3 [Quercus robur]|uniref:uncharacterized protein LOC126717498 isoform X3 n=1 Tax=Quercus robur TaxID=38942 RepID=UPI0021625077|nr:uncharacterized protein LOC126717498 isoform X3 [Quercus robur]
MESEGETADKMRELLADSENHLQSSDTSGSIAWSRDDVFAKVMGKEHKGRIRGVGFGPTPSGQRKNGAKNGSPASTDATNYTMQSGSFSGRTISTSPQIISCISSTRKLISFILEFLDFFVYEELWKNNRIFCKC